MHVASECAVLCWLDFLSNTLLMLSALYIQFGYLQESRVFYVSRLIVNQALVACLS